VRQSSSRIAHETKIPYADTSVCSHLWNSSSLPVNTVQYQNPASEQSVAMLAITAPVARVFISKRRDSSATSESRM